MELTEIDRTAIKFAIECQIQAFLRDDAETAFFYASPDIQSKFGTPKDFIKMVKAAYLPVYRPRAVLFGMVRIVRRIPIQPVFLLSQEGEPMKAIYVMERQFDKSWRIGSCYLSPYAREVETDSWPENI